MYSVARFQFLQQYFLRYGADVPNHPQLAQYVYGSDFANTANKNHLFAILREASRELPLKTWDSDRPFPSKVCQVLLQLIPSLVNSLNIANAAKLPETTPFGFLVPECLDVVRVVSSNPGLAERIRDFSSIISLTTAAKEVKKYIDQSHKLTEDFLKNDSGLIASYVKAQASFDRIGPTDPSGKLFKELYLIALLAMYWYDIIPTIIALESKVTDGTTVQNKTARIIKRIIDSQPIATVEAINNTTKAPEWLFYVNNIDLYLEALKGSVIPERASKVLSSVRGAMTNMTVALKAATQSPEELSYTFGAYTPTQSILQENQRNSGYSKLRKILQEFITKRQRTESSALTSPVPPGSSTLSPNSLAKSNTKINSTVKLHDSMINMTLPTQSFISSLMNDTRGDTDQDEADEFEVDIPSRNLFKLMLEVSENA